MASGVGGGTRGAPLGGGREAGSVRVQRSSFFAEVHADSSRGWPGVSPLEGVGGELGGRGVRWRFVSPLT